MKYLLDGVTVTRKQAERLLPARDGRVIFVYDPSTGLRLETVNRAGRYFLFMLDGTTEPYDDVTLLLDDAGEALQEQADMQPEHLLPAGIYRALLESTASKYDPKVGLVVMFTWRILEGEQAGRAAYSWTTESVAARPFTRDHVRVLGDVVGQDEKSVIMFLDTNACIGKLAKIHVQVRAFVSRECRGCKLDGALGCSEAGLTLQWVNRVTRLEPYDD